MAGVRPPPSLQILMDQELSPDLLSCHAPHTLPLYAVSRGHHAPRHASLFRNGCNQAVRILREFEIEGSEVLVHKEGDRLVLTPVRKHRLADLLAGWEPPAEGVPEVAMVPPQEREPL